MEQGTQWQSTVSEVLYVIVVVSVLDRIGALGLGYWVEHYLDFASVQATMFTGRAVSWRERLRRHLQFFRRVQT